MRAIERGKLKIRVRALEAERAIERVAAMQQVMLKAMVALSAVNVGVVLYVSGLVLQAKIGFGLSAAFGLQAIAAQEAHQAGEEGGAVLRGVIPTLGCDSLCTQLGWVGSLSFSRRDERDAFDSGTLLVVPPWSVLLITL